jgi:hypothetical protein
LGDKSDGWSNHEIVEQFHSLFEVFYDLAITPAIRLNVSYQHIWNPLIVRVAENRNKASVFLARLSVAF